jgi:PST family polysaccharide transporter
MLILTYPAVLFALVTSHDLINIVLGSKWSGVAPLFSILAVGALTAPISNSTGWLFISQGRTREMRNTGIVSSLIYVVSFICGLPWGPVGVATCYIVAGLLRSPFVWRRATSAGAVSFSNLLAALYPYLIAAGLTVGATYGASHILRPGLATLAVLFCLAHLTFALTVLAIPGSRATIADILRQTTPRIPGLRRTAALPPI